MTDISREVVELIQAAKRDIYDISSGSPAKGRLVTVTRLLDYAEGKCTALLARVEELEGDLSNALQASADACEQRADMLDEMGIEVECCVATAKNCASDIEALKGPTS